MALVTVNLLLFLLLIIFFIVMILLAIITKKKIIFMKKKTILYIFCGLILWAASDFIIKNTVFYYDSDTISAMNSEESDIFSINLKNHTIYSEYDFTRFSCKDSENEILDKILKQYKNAYYDERFKQIVIINDNQIFTINRENI